MATMTDTERMVQRLGTTADGGYVVVRVEIREQPGTWQTVTHGEVTNPVELGFQGEHYEPGDRRHNPSRCGQIRDSLSEVTGPAPGWTLEEVAELGNLWDRWHLNAMRAACAHMDPDDLVREATDYGTRISTTDPHITCPETGYKYGSAWLTEPLPGDVLDRVRYLMRDRSDDLYRARGYDGQGRRYPSA